jgi:hypothetical protein
VLKYIIKLNRGGCSVILVLLPISPAVSRGAEGAGLFNTFLKTIRYSFYGTVTTKSAQRIYFKKGSPWSRIPRLKKGEALARLRERKSLGKKSPRLEVVKSKEKD